MSHYDYEVSQEISKKDPPFYALIMACFRKADTDNLKKLQHAFPAVWAEFEERYNTPKGLIKRELFEEFAAALPETLLGRKVIITEASPTHVNLILGDFSIYYRTPEAIRPKIPCPNTYGLLEEEGISEEELDETPSD